jgi:ABC-type antimicrobial peptide transport system permease subunit
VWGVGSRGRASVRGEAEIGGRFRVIALNLGIAAVLGAAFAGAGAGLASTVLARTGWTVVAVVVLVQVLIVACGARPAVAAAIRDRRG